jgi:phosphoribosylamine-glycine ligase
LLTPEQLAEIQHKIFAPVLAGLAAEGAPYRRPVPLPDA